MDAGILYVATGNRCCVEAIENVRRSLSFQKGNISIAIKTDQIELAQNSNVFSEVIDFSRPSHSYRDKIVGMLDLPYRRTLFLDSDACLIRPFDSFLSILDSTDIAASYAPVSHPPGWSDVSVPLLFPELNTGVLLMNHLPVVQSLIRSWLDLYDSLVVSDAQFWDQASFRSALWSSIQQGSLRFLHLPLEANLRTTKPWTAGRGMPVHVVHGRYTPDEFLPFVEYINSDIDRFRTWTEWSALHPDTQIRPRFDRTFG